MKRPAAHLLTLVALALGACGGAEPRADGPCERHWAEGRDCTPAPEDLRARESVAPEIRELHVSFVRSDGGDRVRIDVELLDPDRVVVEGWVFELTLRLGDEAVRETFADLEPVHVERDDAGARLIFEHPVELPAPIPDDAEVVVTARAESAFGALDRRARGPVVLD